MQQPKSDYRLHEEFANRSRKLAELRGMGIEPYPNSFHPSHSLQEIKQSYSEVDVGNSEAAAMGTTVPATIAGRLILFRAMGKNAFAHLQQGEERLQVMFNQELTHLNGYVEGSGLSAYKTIEKKCDLGDLIGVEGHLFRTQKGELTLYAKEVTLLCKTLLPLADKHAGLADKELRYRKRWLDLIANPELLATFKMRSSIIAIARHYLEERKFLEVETPVLQSIYGGAEARPFTTKLNALDQEMFLRISLEIPLKKLIIGGFDRVFEIGKVFRNEGIDRNHNPEFTLLEAYAAYWDYSDMMCLVEELFERVALQLYGTTKIAIPLPHGDDEVELDLKAPWPRLSMRDALLRYGGHAIDRLSDGDIRQLLQESGHCNDKRLNEMSRGLLVAALFEVSVEPLLIQPHHIIDHPIETTPLCKWHRDPELRQQGIVERFESFILGGEICNAYTELNDPELQRSLLEQQAARRQRGDEEAPPCDEEFLEAVAQGMLPTAGVGIGIDRMVMLFTRTHSIRDVLCFPWMKPNC